MDNVVTFLKVNAGEEKTINVCLYHVQFTLLFTSLPWCK